MLLSLNEHGDSIDSLEWQKLHAGPYGTRQLTFDRIQVLIKLHLATFDGKQLVISKIGWHLANVAKLFMNLFGIKS